MAVVGGSIAGLTVANLLRDLGHRVTVFERATGDLRGSGAGIVVHDESLRYFRERTTVGLDRLAVPVRTLQYLARPDQVVYAEPTSYRFTAWNTLYRALRDQASGIDIRLGTPVVRVNDPDAPVLSLASGEEFSADLLVAADGIGSTIRRQLAPGVEPVYAGYVGWRGVAPLARLSTTTRERLGDAITYAVTDEPGHIVAYPIPAPDGAVVSDRLLANYVWYRNVDEDLLPTLMTDRDGRQRGLAMPPGSIREPALRTLLCEARSLLPRPLAELVERSDPFLQAIVDVESSRLVFGRVCILGDAAFAARPHAAAGTAKAAADAWALHDALAAGPDARDSAGLVAGVPAEGRAGTDRPRPRSRPALAGRCHLAARRSRPALRPARTGPVVASRGGVDLRTDRDPEALDANGLRPDPLRLAGHADLRSRRPRRQDDEHLAVAEADSEWLRGSPRDALGATVQDAEDARHGLARLCAGPRWRQRARRAVLQRVDGELEVRLVDDGHGLAETLRDGEGRSVGVLHLRLVIGQDEEHPVSRGCRQHERVGAGHERRIDADRRADRTGRIDGPRRFDRSRFDGHGRAGRRRFDRHSRDRRHRGRSSPHRSRRAAGTRRARAASA